MKDTTVPTITALVLVAITAIMNIWLISVLVNSTNEMAARLEAQASQEHLGIATILATRNQRVLQIANVSPAQQKELQALSTAVMEGRHGEDGTKTVFRVLSAQKLPLEIDQYRQVLLQIERGRLEIQASQAKLQDIKTAYETALASFPQGPLMRAMGYPQVDLKGYDLAGTSAEKVAVMPKGSATNARSGSVLRSASL